MRAWTTIGVVALALGAAAPGAGAAVELRLGAQGLVVRSPSFDPLAEDDALGRAELGLGWELAPVAGDLALRAELAFVGGGRSGTAFQVIESELAVQSLCAGLRLERSWTGGLLPYLRAGGALTIGELTVRDGGAPTAAPLRDVALSPGLYGALGLGWLAPPAAGGRLAFGLDGSLGYFATAPLGFEARPELPDDGRARLPVAAARLGSLELSGVELRIALTARF